MQIEEVKASIGREAGVSEWLVVTQELIHDYAAVSGDRQWIHVDPERARRESPFGATVAHGFLTVALLSRMLSQAVDLRTEAKLRVNYGFNRLRFTGAVPSGARIRGRFALASIKDVEGGIEIAWTATVEVEGRDKPALVAEWLGRTYF